LLPESGCGVQNCAGSDHVFDEKYLAIFDSGLPVPVVDLSIPQDDRPPDMPLYSGPRYTKCLTSRQT
jgi:hypothetical protein